MIRNMKLQLEILASELRDKSKREKKAPNLVLFTHQLGVQKAMCPVQTV